MAFRVRVRKRAGEIARHRSDGRLVVDVQRAVILADEVHQITATDFDVACIVYTGGERKEIELIALGQCLPPCGGIRRAE